VAALGPPEDIPVREHTDPYTAEVSAPFLLGLAMEKIITPRDYWPVVYTYREQFAPLRERVARDQGK
jgi:hypothetical protein